MGHMVKCPSCDRQVWVSDRTVGKLTTCEYCEHMFVAPERGATAVGSTGLSDGTDNLEDVLDHVFDEAEPLVGSASDTGILSAILGDDDPDNATGDLIEIFEAETDQGMIPPPRPSDTEKKKTGIEALRLADVPIDKGDADPAPPRPKSPDYPVADAPALSLGGGSDIDEIYKRIPRSSILLSLVETDGHHVTLEFPSQLLELSVFRASIPMRCMMDPEAEVGDLIARPFAWSDVLKKKGLAAREFGDRYARTPSALMSPREFVESLPPFEQLPRPFNLPMPYYVSKACDKDVEVTCRVLNQGHGVACRVRMPMSTGLLGWMAAVNGVCGPEYAELAMAADQRRDQAWLKLPERVRQRLSVWFHWNPAERFMIYLPDSDFSRQDEGLGGMVLTSRRIVYRKYQRRGVIALHEPGRLFLKWEVNFCVVSYAPGGGECVEVIRLRRDSAQALQLLTENLDCVMTVEEQ